MFFRVGEEIADYIHLAEGWEQLSLYVNFQVNLELYKTGVFFWLAEQLLACQESIFSTEFVTEWVSLVQFS